MDLDSQEDKQACKRFLSALADLSKELGSTLLKREHRCLFTQSYKRMLESSNYSSDLLDAAMVARTRMRINGEKYVFSEHVVNKGIELYSKL